MYTLEATLNLTAYKNSDERGKVEETIDESVEKYYQLGEYSVPEAASDQELDLTGLITTVQELWIVSNQTLTVKFGSDSGTAIQFKKLIISGGSVTSLYFSNSSGSNATVAVYAGG